MKKNAIIRITVYAILILMLVGLLIGGLALHHNFLPMIFWGYNDRPFSTADSGVNSSVPGSSAGLQQAHSGAVASTEISDLEINWASGTITIEPGDTDEITFSESANASEAMVWYVADGKLVIDFCKDDLRFNYRPGRFHKNLTITVPKTWTASEITLNAASCQLEISDLTIGEDLEINGASNHCILSNCTVADVVINGASNNFSLEGALTSFDSDGVSTECTLKLTNHPVKIDLEGVSSKLDLTIPEDCGFRVDSDGLSVRLDTDFPITGERNHFSYGDGNCLINIGGVSSDLTIRKAQ